MKIFQKINETDIKVSHFFVKFYHHHFLNKLMIFIAGSGDFGMIWLAIILLLSLNSTTRVLSQKMLAALLAATLAGQVTVKSLVKRKRPCHTFKDVKMLVPVPSDYSFPSGHTTSSFACAVNIYLFNPIAGIIFISFAILMAFSRLYLFVHYLSDVVFAILLGTTIGIIIALI